MFTDSLPTRCHYETLNAETSMIVNTIKIRDGDRPQPVCIYKSP